MNYRPIRVLLVAVNDGDADHLRHLLDRADLPVTTLRHVTKLSTALMHLTEDTFDIVLLDLTTPDAAGMVTIQVLHDHAPDTAIVVLSGLEDENMALKVVQAGAQDYIVKDYLEPGVFRRTVVLAIQRQEIMLELRRRAFVDQLTGLNNRYGFLTLGTHQLKMSLRTHTAAALFYLDFDGLKVVNDSLGHSAGDDALRQVARLLESTFRDSDILGRIGGDEYVILTIRTNKAESQVLGQRLIQALRAQNNQPNQAWPISISYGVSSFDPANPTTLDSMLSDADQAMYQAKRKRFPRPGL